MSTCRRCGVALSDGTPETSCFPPVTEACTELDGEGTHEVEILSVCDRCGDTAMEKAGRKCGRDLSEERDEPEGTRICGGTYR